MAIPQRFNYCRSLVDNNITDIDPNPDLLNSYIEELLKSGNGSLPDAGILLGGNPYCSQAKLPMSVAQQYLCRSTTSDAIVDMSGARWNGKILGITLGSSVGGFVVLVSSICCAILWKLRKQTHALHEIQEVLADKSKLAVKKLFPSKQALTEFLHEVVLITDIKHPNLVQLKGCCIKDQQRLLVYEYAENGNLAEALWDSTNKKDAETPWKQRKLDWKQRFNICVGVAHGLAYLHEGLQPRIVHRDIKPANILMDKNLNPKIADFGLPRPFLDDESRAHYTAVVGTLGYCAPEYVIQGQLTEKVDVYSFGVLVLEIVSGRPCISRKLPSEEVSLVHWTTNLRNEERLLDLVEPGVRDSCSNDEDVMRVINTALLCVHMDPARRPTMSHVVTMLLGSMDETVFLDSPLYKQPDFKSLPLSPRHPFRASNTVGDLETFREENHEHSLMDMDFMNLSNTFSSGHGGSLPMSDLSART